MLLVRSWVSTEPVVVARERVRIATVTRGPFVRDIAAQGTVVVADSPTLFSSGMGSSRSSSKRAMPSRKGRCSLPLTAPVANEYAREQAALEGLVVSLGRAEIEARRQILESRQAADLANTQIRATGASSSARRAGWKQAWSRKRDLDQAQDQRDDAKLVYDHAVANAKLQKESLEFELKTKRVELERQKLAVAELARRVDGLTVRSPVNGMVGSLAVNQKARAPRTRRC